MKFAVVVLACVAAAAHAQFQRASAFSSFGNFPRPQSAFRAQAPRPGQYQPQQPASGQYQHYQPAPAVVVSPQPAHVHPVAKSFVHDARSANIVKYGNEINPDGSYSYFYETDNGIAAQEQGTPRNFGGNPPVVPDVAQGSFSWTSPEGVPVAITYVADENGYQPQGAAIPTPPPVPAQIARALEYIARNAPRK